MRQKIVDFYEVIKEIEQKSSLVANKSHHAANEASGSLAASYSAAGDVEHAKNTANLSIQKAKQNQLLLSEVEQALNIEAPNTVQPICFLKIDFGESGNKEFYLVENPVYINGYNLISPASPIGKALLGHSVNDLFLYITGDQTFTGKILEIG